MIHRLSHNTAYVLLNHQLICKDDIEHATFFVENCYLKIISFVVTVVISVVTPGFHRSDRIRYVTWIRPS